LGNTTSSKSYIIGISGGSGSGKTTFVNSLASRISADRMTILTMDNYYYPREQQQQDSKGVKNFDLLESIDISAFKNDLRTLSEGKELKLTEYVFNNEKATARDLIIKPAPVIIVEGLFVFSDPELFDMIDLRIIINAKDVIKVIRRIHRDKVERNYPVEDVIYRYQHHVLPSYEKYIEPYLDSVDLIINNNENFDTSLMLLADHILEKSK